MHPQAQAKSQTKTIPEIPRLPQDYERQSSSQKFLSGADISPQVSSSRFFFFLFVFRPPSLFCIIQLWRKGIYDKKEYDKINRLKCK